MKRPAVAGSTMVTYSKTGTQLREKMKSRKFDEIFDELPDHMTDYMKSVSVFLTANYCFSGPSLRVHTTHRTCIGLRFWSHSDHNLKHMQVL